MNSHKHYTFRSHFNLNLLTQISFLTLFSDKKSKIICRLNQNSTFNFHLVSSADLKNKSLECQCLYTVLYGQGIYIQRKWRLYFLHLYMRIVSILCVGKCSQNVRYYTKNPFFYPSPYMFIPASENSMSLKCHTIATLMSLFEFIPGETHSLPPICHQIVTKVLSGGKLTLFCH